MVREGGCIGDTECYLDYKIRPSEGIRPTDVPPKFELSGTGSRCCYDSG